MLLEQQATMQEADFQVPSQQNVIRSLREAGMLPAIWFIFSRVQCDAAAQATQQSGLRLVSPAEAAAIQREVSKLRCGAAAKMHASMNRRYASSPFRKFAEGVGRVKQSMTLTYFSTSEQFRSIRP